MSRDECERLIREMTDPDRGLEGALEAAAAGVLTGTLLQLRQALQDWKSMLEGAASEPQAHVAVVRPGVEVLVKDLERVVEEAVEVLADGAFAVQSCTCSECRAAQVHLN